MPSAHSTAPYHPASLDRFSAHVAARVLAAHPEWTPAAQVRRESGDDASTPGWFLVELTGPSAAAIPLSVRTNRDELTVGFGEWHHHYAGWWHDTEAQWDAGIQEALDDIAEFLSDRRRVAVARTAHGAWHSSWLTDVADTPAVPAGAAVVEVSSWTGGRDETVRAAAEGA